MIKGTDVPSPLLTLSLSRGPFRVFFLIFVETKKGRGLDKMKGSGQRVAFRTSLGCARTLGRIVVDNDGTEAPRL